ncbi:DUF1631 family protein [Variovorax sp. VNK109]|uniref:DUF1631 family protein n=1 Tax=Variovorax sp. VNK109 TaxID=3400919 RepID=UPI003C00FD1B
MATQSSTIRNCLQFAADGAQQFFIRCVDNTVSALQDAEGKALSSAKRNELTLAWRMLLNYKDPMARRFPEMLRGALDGETANASRAADNPMDDRLANAFKPSQLGDDDEDSGFLEDSFSLVDDTQLSQAIETSRLLQRVSAQVEGILPQLDGLMSSALGLPNIAPGLNPVRPDVYVRTLQTLMNESGADGPVVVAWFAHVSAPFASELKALYEKLIQQLKAAGIQPVKYKVGMAPDAAAAGGSGPQGGEGGGTATGGGTGGPGGGGGGGGGPGGGPGGPGGFDGFGENMGGEGVMVVDLSDQQVSQDLFRQFFSGTGGFGPGGGGAGGGSGPRPRRGLAPSFYAAVDQELAALQDEQDTEVLPDSPEDYVDIPVVDRPARYVDASMALNSPMWGDYARAKERALVRTQLKKDATDVDQVMGLELVRQLVNQVAQDVRLLGSMREAIVALEPALARLAMIDPRFISESAHPGRKLIERVAQRSFRYNDELAQDFNQFFEPVGEAFNKLNQIEEVENDVPFSEALVELEKLWDEEDRAELDARNAVVDAMRFAEERQAMANQLAYEISQRTDLDLVPASILDFLYNRWTLVMAHARLKDTKAQIDPGGYGSLISDLLWSTKHDLTLNQPAKLIQLIPPMVRKIVEGLDMLGADAAEKQAFFDTLERLHKPVLELCRTRNRAEWARDGFQDTRPAAPEAPATAEERVAKPKNMPWLGKQFLDAVGFEEPLATNSEFSSSEFSSSMLPDSNFDSSSFDSSSMPLEPPPTEPPGATTDGADGASAPATPAEQQVQLTPSQVIKGLKLGGWVDLYSKENWLRAQLIWASTRRTLFMFESHGGSPHSMTRRSCERLIRTRMLRPVDMHEVVNRALEAIAKENSVDVPPDSAYSESQYSGTDSQFAAQAEDLKLAN